MLMCVFGSLSPCITNFFHPASGTKEIHAGVYHRLMSPCHGTVGGFLFPLLSCCLRGGSARKKNSRKVRKRASESVKKSFFWAWSWVIGEGEKEERSVSCLLTLACMLVDIFFCFMHGIDGWMGWMGRDGRELGELCIFYFFCCLGIFICFLYCGCGSILCLLSSFFMSTPFPSFELEKKEKEKKIVWKDAEGIGAWLMLLLLLAIINKRKLCTHRQHSETKQKHKAQGPKKRKEKKGQALTFWHVLFFSLQKSIDMGLESIQEDASWHTRQVKEIVGHQNTHKKRKESPLLLLMFVVQCIALQHSIFLCLLCMCVCSCGVCVQKGNEDVWGGGTRRKDERSKRGRKRRWWWRDT